MEIPITMQTGRDEDASVHMDNIADDIALENQYLSFCVGEEVYAVGVKHVLKITVAEALTALPQAPPHIKGFFHLRGDVIPVLDLRDRFAKDTAMRDDRGCIIIVTVSEKKQGLFVDSIRETLYVQPEQVSPMPIDNLYVKGVMHRGEETVMLVDIYKLMAE